MSRSVRVKCAKCEREATLRVPYAKLSLCSDHYVEYFERRVLGVISRYRLFRSGDRVLVAVSGGKDSLTALRVLSKYRSVLGVELAGVHLDLGLGAHSEESRRVVLESCRESGVECYIIPLSEILGYTLPELVRRSRRPPCSLCGLVKRYLLNAAALEWGFSVVVTGHHMDDILVFRLKEALTGQREHEAAKLAPFTPGAPGLYAARARPLYEAYEWEIKLYRELAGIRHVEAPCPFKYRDVISASIAEMLEKIEREIPGFKISLARRLAKSSAGDATRGVTPCKYCQMPSSSGVCSLCRLTLRTHGEPMGPLVRERLRGVVKTE